MLFHVYDEPVPKGYYSVEPFDLYRKILDADWLLYILLPLLALIIVTLLPWLTGMSGLIYLVVALGLNAAFLAYAVALKRSQRKELPMKVFHFSVQYLMWLFLALLVDHYLPLRLF